MPTYMTRFVYGGGGWRKRSKNPEDRSVPVKALLEKLGGRLIIMYYMEGDADGFIIYEAPDAKADWDREHCRGDDGSRWQRRQARPPCTQGLIPTRNVHTRRQVLGVLPALALASAGAESQPRLKVIGVLSPYTAQTYRPFREVFLRAMAESGYVEGKRFVMVERFAEGDNGRLPQMATELVHLAVDVIVASSTDAAKAAQQATAVIPIVFEGVADPVMAGFAQSVARPGRNMTGLSNFAADLNPKRLQLLKQMVPGLSTVAVLANPKNPYYSTQLQRMRPAAEQLGLRLFLVADGRTDDLESAFQEMERRHAEAFLVTADAYLWLQGRQINYLALKYKLPSISAFEDWVDAGGLISYGVNPAESMDRVASFVDRIFKGLRPEEIPIEQPKTLILVVNRTTAKLLGITIPQAISLQADRVVG